MGKKGDLLRAMKAQQTTYTFTREQLIEHDRKVKHDILMQAKNDLEAEAKRRYTAKYGPLTPDDLLRSESFGWLEDPWPWMYRQKGE